MPAYVFYTHWPEKPRASSDLSHCSCESVEINLKTIFIEYALNFSSTKLRILHEPETFMTL